MTVYNWNVSRALSDQVNYTEKVCFAKKWKCILVVFLSECCNTSPLIGKDACNRYLQI